MNEETNNPEPQQEEKQNAFNTVTPLSRILALILFIVLPFIGFWLGYKYAPLKVVEVEKVVVKEVANESINTTKKMTPEEYVLTHNSCVHDSDCVIVREGFGCCADGVSIRKDELSGYLSYFGDEIKEEDSYCEMEYERGLSCGAHAQQYDILGYQSVCVENTCVIKDETENSF